MPIDAPTVRDVAPDSSRLEGHERALAAAYGGVHLVSLGLVMAGMFTSVLGWGPGALLMVAGLVGTLLNDLWFAVLMYRDIMSRPWPKVASLDDEDDEWGIPAGSYSRPTPRAHEA